MMRRNIGHNIRAIRKSLPGELSMEDFGKLFSPPASRGVVSNWENNYNYPNEARLKRISELGGVTVDLLLYGDVIEPQTKKVIKTFNRHSLQTERVTVEVSDSQTLWVNDRPINLEELGLKLVKDD